MCNLFVKFEFFEAAGLVGVEYAHGGRVGLLVGEVLALHRI